MKIPDGYNTEYTIFTFKDNKLNLLLIKNNVNEYCIPGKFIEKNQTAKDVVDKNIAKYFTIKNEQYFARHIAVFDDPQRDYRGWIISNVFYVIVNYNDLNEYRGNFYPVDEISQMNIAYDHKEIIEKMIENIRKDLYETTIAKHFLDNHFTISELQALLLSAREVGEISRTHFFTKIKTMPFIKPVLGVDNKHMTKTRAGVKRPAKLYQFDETDYISSIYF